MDEPVNKTSPSDDEVHLLDYLIILAKHSRMIIYASAAVTVLTYFCLFFSPNVYTSTARLLSPHQNQTLSAQLLNNLGGGFTPGTGPNAATSGGIAASLLGIQSPADFYVGLLGCVSLLDRMIVRFNLIKLYNVTSSEDAMKTLISNSKISAGKRSGIISIEVTDKDAKRVAEIANAFIEELDKLLQGLARREAGGRLAFLEKEREQAIHNLTKAEETLRTFSEKNSVLQIDAQTRGTIEYIAKLRGEIDVKEVQIQVLRQQATSFNYDVVRLETECKGLKEKLRAAETQYENCVSDVCLPSSKAPAIGLEYIRLFREAKFQESLYQLYVRLVETARLDMARNFSVIQALDPGIPPEKRSNKRLRPALQFGILTFFIMIFIPFVQKYWQQSIVKDDLQKMSIITNYMEPWCRVPKKILLLFNKNK